MAKSALMRQLLVLAAAVVLAAGCGTVGHTDLAPGVMKVQELNETGSSTLFQVETEDGTVCLIWSGASGRGGMDCDFDADLSVDEGSVSNETLRRYYDDHPLPPREPEDPLPE